MNNERVIRAFLRGEQAKTPLREIQGVYIYKGRTLWTNGNILVNYSTNMAKLDIENNVVYINKNKYSRTTSKIQTQIKSLANQYNYQVIEVEPKEL